MSTIVVGRVHAASLDLLRGALDQCGRGDGWMCCVGSMLTEVSYPNLGLLDQPERCSLGVFVLRSGSYSYPCRGIRLGGFRGEGAIWAGIFWFDRWLRFGPFVRRGAAKGCSGCAVVKVELVPEVVDVVVAMGADNVVFV